MIAVSQIMFCRDLTDCLDTTDNVLDAVKEAEERCFQVRLHDCRNNCNEHSAPLL